MITHTKSNILVCYYYKGMVCHFVPYYNLAYYNLSKFSTSLIVSLRQFPILGTRYKTVLFPKLADAFLMMYQTAAVGIFTNIGAFGGFHHGNPVSIERVHLDDFGMEKARKRRIVGV